MAAVLLLMTCTAAGFERRRRLAARVRELQSCLLMTGMLASQLRYARLPVGDLLALLCGSEALGALRFLPLCRALYLDGGDFSAAWRDALRRERGALCREDAALLLSLGAQLGTTDLDGQLGQLTLHETMLASALEQARAALAKNGTLCVLAGGCTGLLAAFAFW